MARKRRKPIELNQTELATMLGLTTRQIRNLEIAGMPHGAEKNSKRYPLPDALDWYYSRKYTPDEPTTMEEAKLRKLSAEADMAQLELAEMRRELWRVSDSADELGRALEQVDAALRNAPSRYAPDLAQVADLKVPKAQRFLADVIERIRAELKLVGENDERAA